MKGIKGVALPVIIAATFALVGLFHLQNIARADAPSVIINEMMYNPGTAIDGDEFLEIYNTTEAAIDLTGWCFTAGITLCFSPGTILSGQSYGVVSPNSTQTQTTYGVNTIGSYTGKLDNGGERVTLTNASAEIVNSVQYDDVSPWPTAPDGTGPSLELKDPTFDNTAAASWTASNDGATPGAVNSVQGAALPDITDVVKPQNVQPDDQPLVTAEVSGADSVELVYKVMFDSEQQLVMNDSGTDGDQIAADGVYSARLPEQAAGQLVRYKVVAQNSGGSLNLPGSSDTINYYGYTIKDSSFETQLPVLEWFIKDDDLADMVANHSHDDQEFDCVVSYGGDTVIDNAKVHIKGQTTRNLVKKAFAIDLPQGHKLQMDGMTRQVDEFHLNSTYLDASGLVDVMAWRLAEQIGMPITQVFKTRLQHNGQFYGLYTFAEEYDKQWREEFNFQDGSFYKGQDKKTREDIDDGNERNEWNTAVSSNNRSDRVAYAINNQDVPNTINLMAFNTFIRNTDVTFGKNWISYHDINGTGRWKSLPYDLDSPFGVVSIWAPGQHYVSPYEMAGTQGAFTRQWRGPLLALYDDPTYRQLYYRRLRTLTDNYLLSGWLDQQYNDIKTKSDPEFVMDYTKWGSISDAALTRQYIPEVLSEMKYNLANRFRNEWLVPEAQTNNPVVDIETVNVNVGDHSQDYIILKNSSSETIDMSLWQIPELNFVLPPGSVIAPNQEAVIPRNDPLYSQAHVNSYIIGQLEVDIPALGTLTLQRVNGSTSDTKVVFE